MKWNISKTLNGILCFFVLLIGNSAVGQEDLPKRVLFVGNSYTYFWNLPHHVNLMAESQGIKIETIQSTAGGSHWGHHWRGERELETIRILREGNYDAVVLQNHSMSTIHRVDSVMIYGQKLAEIIDSIGAQIYLFETWSREWDPYMLKTISEKYIELGEKINAKVIPVGRAWKKALELRPGIPLYDDDGSHPSPLGTYLSACVFYNVFTGKDPVGLPHRLLSKDINGEKTYINIQSEQNAIFCQKVAREVSSMVFNH